MALASVDEALQDLELLKKKMGIFVSVDDLKMCLSALRTFLLCAGKWHTDVSSKSDENTSSIFSTMGSSLSRVEDSLIQYGKDFHNLCVGVQKAATYEIESLEDGVMFLVSNFGYCMYTFSQEISESYIILANYCSLQSWAQSTEFIESLLLNMVAIGDCTVWQDTFQIKTFIDKLVFLKNFLRFAELRGLEPWQLQVLFTHLQIVAINAARVCQEWMFLMNGDQKNLRNEFLLKLSEVFQKIKPADPQVREIYIHVLTGSNVPGTSHALFLERDKHVLGDFIDSLLYKIWEALTYSDSYMVSVKDQVPKFCEGLRFLRTILTDHLEKIDELHENAKDLIGAAVNEAAIVICSHELQEVLAKEMDFTLFIFLEKIKLIKVITSSSIFPWSNQHGYVDFLQENLKELSSCKVDSIAFAQDQIQTVQKDLASLIYLLGSIWDQQNRDGKFQSLWSRIAEVAYKTGVIIESLVVGDIPDISPLEFNSITEEAAVIKLEAFKIGDSQHRSKAQKADKASSPFSSQDSTTAINKIGGILDDEANKIIGLLRGGSKPLDIISIVGMPGLGKTTLARRVYDDPSVRDHFHVRAWCVVSYIYKKKHLLLQILGSVDPNFSDDNCLKKNDEELEEMLKRCLLKRRYLIILDDVWDTKAWTDLEKSFPKDANSSRILITSRLAKVAKEINPNSVPHSLRLLTDDESWDLLQKKLARKESYSLDLGMSIAKNCKGLPLTIVIVAGILTNLGQDGWAEIVKRLSLSNLPILDRCMDMLEVSYKKLPEYLKSCFLYFGAFGEDEEISYKKLIWLWMAEGFVQKSEAKNLEDVATDYMNDLISRSLVMVSEERSIGGVKKCRIHDVLHEFCVEKAKKEKFMCILSGQDEVFTFQVQRLCVHSTLKHFVKSMPFSAGVRSFLFFPNENHPLEYINGISHIFCFFKLQVLDLMHFNLKSDFPREILLFVELRYLALGGMFGNVPSAIANLSNLETLILVKHYNSSISLPVTIWNMSKLRVLWSSGSFRLDLDKDNLESLPNLSNLDTFCPLKVPSWQSLEKIMRKLPNIRKLKCILDECSRDSNANCNRIVAMDVWSRLESLNLSEITMDKYHIEFRFPSNLKRLTLSFFHQSIIPKRGELPNLEVLKLDCIDYERYAWDMNEEWEFSNLKVLKLNYLTIDRWTGTDGVDHFPCLEKLVLHYCDKLKEIPSCLKEITTLQMIKVCGGPKSIESLIMQIKEYQKDYWGNEDLQVLFTDIY